MRRFPHHIVELKQSGISLVVDRRGVIRSVSASGNPAVAHLTPAVVGCHISSLFPTSVVPERMHSRSTADKVVNHMFGAGLTLNVVLRTVDGEVAARIAAAIDELDEGIRTLARDAVLRGHEDVAPLVMSSQCGDGLPTG
jgi:hypothetical protein